MLATAAGLGLAQRVRAARLGEAPLQARVARVEEEEAHVGAAGELVLASLPGQAWPLLATL